MNCRICKNKEARQFSSMCQSCIDDGWRKNNGIGKYGYYNVNYNLGFDVLEKEKPIPKSIHRIKPKVVK